MLLSPLATVAAQNTTCPADCIVTSDQGNVFNLSALKGREFIQGDPKRSTVSFTLCGTNPVKCNGTYPYARDPLLQSGMAAMTMFDTQCEILGVYSDQLGGCKWTEPASGNGITLTLQNGSPYLCGMTNHRGVTIHLTCPQNRSQLVPGGWSGSTTRSCMNGGTGQWTFSFATCAACDTGCMPVCKGAWDCFGHGRCVAQDQCTCDPGFNSSKSCETCLSTNWGPSCQACPTGGQGHLKTVCAGHGTCSGAGTTGGTGDCKCDTGWADNRNAGKCSVCASGYGPPGQCTDFNCTQGCTHGTCNAPNNCTCDNHWAGYSCDKCSPGHSGELCSDCSAGRYQDESGQTVCNPCPAGTYQEKTASTQCLTCESGQSSGAGAVSCIELLIITNSTCGKMRYRTILSLSDCLAIINTSAVQTYAAQLYNGTVREVDAVPLSHGSYFPAGCYVDHTEKGDPVGYMNKAFSTVQPDCGPEYYRFCVCGPKLQNYHTSATIPVPPIGRFSGTKYNNRTKYNKTKI